MNEPYILLVEDELHIAQGLKFNLEMEGFQVEHVTTGEQALARRPWNGCCLVILDRMLPGMDGLQVCRTLRQEKEQLPILMLTAMDKEQDRVAGLAEGADDYLTKPFSLDEFLLRVKGILRRAGWYRPEAAAEECYSFAENRVYLQQQRAISKNQEIALTELETRMLQVFFRHEGEVLSRAKLLESVWGVAPDTETRTLDNFIVRLRKYFERRPNRPQHFLTVRGRGYRFIRHPED
ncbi:MAG: response regulator transcription factor [Syntrophotaleaceae bacterium]